MINLGLVLPTYIYNQERLEWAERSFRSLERTTWVDSAPLILVVARAGGMTPSHYPLNSVPQYQPVDMTNIDQAVAWGFDLLFTDYPRLTHGFFIADDYIYNPLWYFELICLIERHHTAKGWTVYRSGNTHWHRTISVDQYGDHLVTSISGPGAISREEWKEWDFFHVVPPRPLTLDILHSETRPGERWATGKSYIQQIGVRGVHNTGEECDVALDFVGE